MSSILWDPNARKFLRKLPKNVANRIFNKVDKEINNNVERYLKVLVNMDGYKIRVGDYRLFVDYYKENDMLIIRAIRHRGEAYKKHKII